MFFYKFGIIKVFKKKPNIKSIKEKDGRLDNIKLKNFSTEKPL